MTVIYLDSNENPKTIDNVELQSNMIKPVREKIRFAGNPHFYQHNAVGKGQIPGNSTPFSSNTMLRKTEISIYLEHR